MTGNSPKKDRPSLTIAFKTIGCRANQADTARMISSLPDGTQVVDSRSERCDTVIINTCTVTSRAEADCRRAIRRARRNHPHATIIVTGCASQVNPGIWSKMPEVDRVIGITERDRIADYLVLLQQADKVAVSKPSGGVLGPTPLVGHRSRPFLKIQDGCSRGCTYCIVPQARGPERSRPSKQVKEDILRLADSDYHEIVLTGVHLGRWGVDIGQGFFDLLDVLETIDADVRLRLSSIEPMDLTPNLIQRMLRHKLICPHLHLPLQSGDDRILEAMGRGHTVRQYAELIEAAIATCPDMALGTDIMIGFPGEDEKCFQATLDLIAKQPFTYLHLFTFSPRPQTPASKLPNRPSGTAVKNRMRALKELDDARRAAFLEANHGVRRPFLIESPPLRSGEHTAISDNYIRAVIKTDRAGIRPGQVVPLILDISNTKVLGSRGLPYGIPDCG